MNRSEFSNYILCKYNIKGDHPFSDDFDTCVFRHNDTKKWFALVMNIPKSKFISGATGNIDVVNLKCSTEIIDSLWQDDGIFPAYHMNKKHWISVFLDGSVDKDTLTWLLEISHKLTKSPHSRNKSSGKD